MSELMKIKKLIKYFLLIVILLFFSYIGVKQINNIANKQNALENDKDISFDIYAYENNNMKMLVTVTDVENGIKTIQYERQGQKINQYCNLKKRVSIDYEITEDGEYKFIAISGKDEVIEKTLIIDKAYRDQIIDIQISSNDKIETEKEITINYRNLENNTYKIGESSSNWIEYTQPFKINSYEILKDKLENEDKTLNIYAKSEDKANNRVIIMKQIVNLDLDMPDQPQINVSNLGDYARIEEGKIKLKSYIDIIYDSRKDTINLYSTDNGENWNEYNGAFEYEKIDILAKTVKKETGLNISSTRRIEPGASDAIGTVAYDGTVNTVFRTDDIKYIDVSSDMIDKNISFEIQRGNSGYNQYIFFIDNDGNVIESYTLTSGGKYKYTIPENTTKIGYQGSTSDYASGWAGANKYHARLLEIEIENEPKINITPVYPKLNLDNTVEEPYYIADIEYNIWSKEKLFKIDDGEWQEYTGKLKVEVGQTIYAKGIDKDTDNTKEVMYNCTQGDFMSKEAYDNDNSTVVTTDNTCYISIGNELIGKEISFYILRGNGGINQYIYFEDDNGNVIESYTLTSGGIYKYNIPTNTTKIGYKGSTANYTTGWAGSSKHYARLVDIWVE